MVIIAAMFYAVGAVSYRSYIIRKSSRFEYGAVPVSVDPAAISSYGTVVLPARYVNLGPVREGKFYIGTCSSTTGESKHCFAYESDDGMSVRLLKDFSDGKVDAALFATPEEQNLFQAFEEIQTLADAHIDADRYTEALSEMARLRQPVDAFFDTVLVMAKEEQIRFNRLSLLEAISRLFLRIADFAKIVTDS